jgi:maltose alpha-D-glucosyltransferase/alpha-amylase
MQWMSGPNGGFSCVSGGELRVPMIDDGPFGYQHVNVADQQRDPDSLLNWFEHVIRTRKFCPEFGRGDWSVIETGAPGVFAHGATWRNASVIAIHNLARTPASVTIELGPFRKRLIVDLLGDRHYHPVETSTHRIELEPYGFRWFRLSDEQLFAL